MKKQDEDGKEPKFRKAVETEKLYGYYEQLEGIAQSVTPLVSKEVDHIGRNLYSIELENDDEDKNVTLCHVPALFRWTQATGDDGAVSDVSNEAYGGSAAALLAMHHFNTGDVSIVDELAENHETCPIRLTTEFVDTLSSGIVATRRLLRLLTRSPQLVSSVNTTGNNDTTSQLQNLQACAVLGSSWSSVTRKLATLTGVYDIPQVTSSASSVTLDDPAEYPLFARTHPSDLSMAQLSVDYLVQVLDVRYFAVVYIDNAFGDSYHTAILDQAATYHQSSSVKVASVSFRSDATREELESSLQQLEGYRYFLGVFFRSEYELVMETAASLGLTGPGHLWMFNGALASSFVNGQLDINKETQPELWEATYGSAILHDEGGVPGLPLYDRFLEQWRRIGSDEDIASKDSPHSSFLDYINSHVPDGSSGRSADYFQEPASHIAAFSYDAVIGLGLAACQALSDTKGANPDPEIFSGSEHHSAFVLNQFMGATGNVTIGPGSFSRRGLSTFHMVSNILPMNETQSQNANITSFRAIPTKLFDTDGSQWIPYSNHTFVYSDQSTVRPAPLAVLQTDTNNAGTPTRAVCLALSFYGMCLALGFGGLTIWKRQHRVILASQPGFLIMVCVGALLMASSIVPATIDDSVASQDGCSVACISKLWLVSVGFVVSFSGLFSKLWRLNKLVDNASGFRRVKVNTHDVLVPFGVLLGLNVLVLTVWTAAFPPYWAREIVTYDIYGRQKETMGSCNLGEHGAIFGSIIIVINGCALILALWQAYVARNITTDFAESKYIGMATTCIFQALFIGVPIFFIVDDNATAKMFVYSGIVTIVVSSLLLLIFVPKINAIRRDEPLRPVQRSSVASRKSQVDSACLRSSVISEPLSVVHEESL